MSKRKEITQKVFTTREPSYPKLSSERIVAAEREMNTILKRKDVESTANPANEGDVLVVFVHGFAASKYCWLDPDIGNMGWIKDYDNDPKPRDFGWHAIPPPLYFPVDWTLSRHIIPPGAHEYVQKMNVEWLTYSQKSAFGDIKISVKELQDIMDAIKKVYGQRRIIIIAHSRGGLISKRYLDTAVTTDVEKLVTFGTPFGGTFLSSIEVFRTPSKVFLTRFRTARKLWDVEEERKIENIATKQMAPGSDFLTTLVNDGLRKNVDFVNVAGSCSMISNVYAWRWARSSLKRQYTLARKMKKKRNQLIREEKPMKDWYNLPSNWVLHAHNWVLEAKKILQIYPKIGYPEVMKGDGAVAVESALLPCPEVKYYVIHKNHFDMTCCDAGYDIMVREIKSTLKTS
ncbi:MAG: lipase family alpha/beta hydrolase [Candidatus Heimdallarchaeota archaeon]